MLPSHTNGRARSTATSLEVPRAPPTRIIAVATTGTAANGPGKSSCPVMTNADTTTPVSPAQERIRPTHIGRRRHEAVPNASRLPVPSSHARAVVEKYALLGSVPVSARAMTAEAMTAVDRTTIARARGAFVVRMASVATRTTGTTR